MTHRSENSTFRTILPVGLGIAIGMALGAVALANVPVTKKAVAPVQAAQAVSVKPLSSAPGISFAKVNSDGERCFAARRPQASEIICTH